LLCSRYVLLHPVHCCSCVAVSSSLPIPYPLAPRSLLTPHCRPSRCTVACACLQSAHRWMEHELGDGHETHVPGTCSFIPPDVAAASLCRCRPCPCFAIAAHSIWPSVPCSTVESGFFQSAHRWMGRGLGDRNGKPVEFCHCLQSAHWWMEHGVGDGHEILVR